jgi:CRP-like cAMP-binding protein
MFIAVKAYYRKLVPHISEDELVALENCLTVRKLQKGDFLVKAGQVCNHVSFINKGLIRIYYSVDGKDISIGFVGEGEYTSEYESFLTRKPAVQNLEVLSDAELIDLSFDDMQHLYKEYPAFQEFGRKIAEMLFIMLNQRNTALLALSPEDRYRKMIEVNSMLLQQVPQYMLASYIGVTPEHLSRIRKKMSIY